MDAKNLRTESSMSERSNDDNAKYTQGSTVLQCNRKNPYQDIGSNSLGKVEVQTARPCAVIGPDRIVPPPVSTDAYMKKTSIEPWAGDHIYRQPPEYPHKMSDYHLPTRNISPRQTFQENMQRIMVPPSYNTLKLKEDHNFPVDANVSSLRNTKLNVPTEAKYCDVPYSVNSITSDQKTVRNPEVSVSNINAGLPRNVPHAWPPASATIRPPKPYGAPEMYPYVEYPSCGGPRPMVMSRSQRIIHEDPPPVYSDPFYHESSLRFKPYPPVKERYPHARYDYIGNYSAPFQPPHLPPHKYDIQKTIPSHPYTGYPQVPLKYLDSRIPEQFMNGYQRPLNPQHNFNAVPFRNQVMHPGYGPVASNCLQTNKYFPYQTDSSVKPMTTNKLPYDAAHKMYAEYENSRVKPYGMTENFYVNEMGRQVMKGQVLPPSYPSVNIHPLPPHPYYRKDNVTLKQYEYNQQFRNIDQSININGATISRLPSQFSPGNIAISPSDSNTSNETSHTQSTLPEDCGYVSQSSTASIRSMESGITRIPSDPYKRFDYRYGPIARTSSLSSKLETNAKNKKVTNVRQFLQMWNEEEDNGENTTKDVSVKSANANEISNHFEKSNQEQLYVLGLVNVPREELSKYEHIQKVSKLPENIKGYNSIELLNQFEEAIESSNLNYYNYKPHNSRDYVPLKGQSTMHTLGIPSRPLSPLDVEAKISQSVIHKEVGCNFEIKPCSPKMLNVDVPTPVQFLKERSIEKVSNHLMINSPQNQNVSDNAINCTIINHQEHRISKDKAPSCKMVNTIYDSVGSEKTDYSLQDLESSSGVCLASLPRLDNDIELNFPEVNQQFINANKVESVIITTPKNLPTLDLDQPAMDQELKEKKVEEKHEGEKALTKLSKYRKQKRKESECTENRSEANAFRTDSVIIKNPENKNQEDNFKDFTNLTEIPLKHDPINLAIKTDSINSDSKIECGQNNCYEDTSNALAINFSLNSNINSIVSDLTDPNKINLCSPNENKSSSLTVDTKIEDKNNSDLITENDIFSFNNSDVDFISCTNVCKNFHTEENISKDVNVFKTLGENIKKSMPNEIENSKILPVENIQDTAGKNENQSNQMYNQMPEINIVNSDPKIYIESESIIQDLDIYNVDSNKTSLKNYCHVSKELFSPYIQNLALFSEGLCSDAAQRFDVKLEHNKTDVSLTVLDINNKNELRKNSSKEMENEKAVKVHISDIIEKDTGTKTDESLNVSDKNNKHEPRATSGKEMYSENTLFAHDSDIDENITKTDASISVLDKNNKHEPLETSSKEKDSKKKVTIHNFNIDEKDNSSKTEESLSVLDINNKYESQEISRNELESEKAGIGYGSEIGEKVCRSSNNKELFAIENCEHINAKILVDYSDCEDDNTEDALSALEDKRSTQYIFDDNKCNTGHIANHLLFKNTSVDCIENMEKGSIDKVKTTDSNSMLSDSFAEDNNINNVYQTQTVSDTSIKINSVSENIDIGEGLFATNETDKNYNAVPIIENNSHDASRELEELDVNNEDSTDFIEENPCLEDTKMENSMIILNELENSPVNLKLAKTSSDYNTSKINNDGMESKDSNVDNQINSLIHHVTETQSTQKLNEVSSNNKMTNDSNIESIEETKQNDIESANIDLMGMNTNESQKKEFITQKNHELAQSCDKVVNQTETSDIFFQMEISNDSIFPQENPENVNRRRSLKRSLSDSALNLHSTFYRPDCEQDCTADESLWPAKRKRLRFKNFVEPEVITNNYANRRNSISSFYNEENVSFCILIDNDCIITEDDSTHEKICFTEITEDCISCVETGGTHDYRSIENEDEILRSADFNSERINKSYVLDSAEEEKSFEEVWVQDVACVETVVTDDVAEDVELSASSSPKSIDTSCEESNNNESNLFDVNNHSDKVKYIYGDEMCSSDALLVETLYRTPQMDVTALINRESNFIDDGTRCYDNESLEDILSDYNNDTHKTSNYESSKKCSTPFSPTPLHLLDSNLETLAMVENSLMSDSASLKSSMSNSLLLTQDDTVHSCESSNDNVFSYDGQPEENTNHTVSSSPEVSSTTSEEKNSGILLKITNYGGSRISEINETPSNKKHNTVSCKYTETKDYISTDNNLPVRPLITKAAQKYIPPLKESIRDLKVKLPLPPQSLIKLKQLKMSKDEPKPNVSKNNLNILRKEVPKKSKPKFEDVLKSIDEIQFKNYKEKSKKVKKYIPKVVIKKNENGSHYASTSNVDKYNPDLTGMKWQPWVFLDKNSFIDKMALRKNTRAIFSHRKNTYVLAETFKKYKSISSNTRFVISQPEINESSTGKLKYTIRLKHSY